MERCLFFCNSWNFFKSDAIGNLITLKFAHLTLKFLIYSHRHLIYENCWQIAIKGQNKFIISWSYFNLFKPRQSWKTSTTSLQKVREKDHKCQLNIFTIRLNWWSASVELLNCSLLSTYFCFLEIFFTFSSKENNSISEVFSQNFFAFSWVLFYISIFGSSKVQNIFSGFLSTLFCV